MHARMRQRIDDPQTLICDLGIAGTQTLAANGAHDSSPVHSIGREYLRRTAAEDSMRTVIAGVDEVIAQAFAEEKLFSELGVPWARPGRVVQLKEYELFPGVG
jgi:hypothetical protein